MINQSILIIALSARPFVAAAKRAGYVVTAIDAFADRQTVELADTTIIVDVGYYGFNAEALLNAVSKLDASQYLGFVYGSGFEAQPALLQKVADIIPLIGNAPATVRAVKNASDFFAALTRCDIAHPRVCDTLPASHHQDVYLRKFTAGCGGTHIKMAVSADAVLDVNHYYQQHIDGRAISLLFIANSKEIEVVGFNEQWLSPSAIMPFRYGGAVSRIVLAQAIQQQLISAAKKLTLEFGLLGLNSLDAIVRDDVAYVLEINPRLSATVDLYAADINQANMKKAGLYESDEINLLDWHVQVNLKSSNLKRSISPGIGALNVSTPSKAHAIVYAASDMAVSATFEWPSWVVDNPHHATQHKMMKILAGEPVCTVLAHAEHADEAKQLAHSRVTIMQQLLQKIVEKGNTCKTHQYHNH